MNHPPESDQFELSGSEAIHVIKSLRKRAGNELIVFNGEGGAWLTRITKVKGSYVNLEIVEELKVELPPRIRMQIAVGVVKGSRMDWAVEKAGEAGVESFIPLKTKRSVIEAGEGRLERWRLKAVAAAKQSRRARLMQILPPISFIEFCGNISDPENYRALHIHPASINLESALNDIKGMSNLGFIIGPEGGFSEEEESILQEKGIKFVSMGMHPVRTETAVCVISGLISSIFS